MQEKIVSSDLFVNNVGVLFSFSIISVIVLYFIAISRAWGVNTT